MPNVLGTMVSKRDKQESLIPALNSAAFVSQTLYKEASLVKLMSYWGSLYSCGEDNIRFGL